MTDEIREVAPKRRPGMVARAAALLRTQWARQRSRLEVAWPAPRGRGPSFAITGFHTPFDELARLIDHPDVRRALAGSSSRSPITLEPPPIVWPRTDRVSSAPRLSPRRVYDVVPFAFELDMLELRLLTLDHVVDRFVIVESDHGFGGVSKGIRFDPSAPRFKRYASKIEHITIAGDVITSQYPGRRRGPTDFRGEDAFRASLWRSVRERVVFEPGSLAISADLDELPPPNLIDWLRHHDAALPWRLDLATLRYSFRWRDAETPAQLVLLTPESFDWIDAAPHRMRHLPGRVIAARGAVHLTSFLHPLALIAKFAATTDWEPEIVPFLRNRHDDTARMMASGRWFGRRLQPYDADRDTDGLVPWPARAARDHFAEFWDRNVNGDLPRT